MRAQTTVPVRVRRVVLLLISAFVVIHFLVPQIAGVHRALYRLGQVKVPWLLLAVALEAASILAYTLLTRAVLLHSRPPRFDVLVRTQLSSLGVNHVVPGGAAAGGALSYRLLTEAGLSGTDTAFALATQSAGSAVVLNLLLWTGLVVSIPLHGYNPLYGTAGLLGALLIAAFAAVVVLLMRGEERAVQVLRAAAGRLPVLDPDRVVAITRRLADRLRTLVADRALVGRATGWAAANWLLDAASLWVFLRAFGQSVDVDALLIAFGLVNIALVVPITPGGIGLFETAMVTLLVGFGLPKAAASLGVISYRLAQYWLPIVVGGLLYATLRVGPWSIGRRERLKGLRELAAETAYNRESSLDFAARFTRRRGKAVDYTQPGRYPPPASEDVTTEIHDDS